MNEKYSVKQICDSFSGMIYEYQLKPLIQTQTGILTEMNMPCLTERMKQR